MNCATPASPAGLVTSVRNRLSCHNTLVRNDAGSSQRRAAPSTMRQIFSCGFSVCCTSSAAVVRPAITKASPAAASAATGVRPPSICLLVPQSRAKHAEARCQDQVRAVTKAAYRRCGSAAPQLQDGAARDLAVSHRRERRAGLFQQKDRRRRGLQLSLLVEAEDLGEAGGDLLRAPLAVIADL